MAFKQNLFNIRKDVEDILLFFLITIGILIISLPEIIYNFTIQCFRLTPVYKKRKKFNNKIDDIARDFEKMEDTYKEILKNKKFKNGLVADIENLRLSQSDIIAYICDNKEKFRLTEKDCQKIIDAFSNKDYLEKYIKFNDIVIVLRNLKYTKFMYYKQIISWH